uniref:HDOD domain-containing protein n=1 Tax=Desulfacinum infernum TaxID=35837 RepID=A0A831ZYQ5_9BACT
MKESGRPTSGGTGEGAAFRGVNYWARIVGREELPVLRSTVMTIARLFSQTGTSSSAMADAVARDPFMTARLVRMANSAYYNPGLKKVSAVHRAVVVVGFDAVRHLCVSARFVEETYGGERLEEILRRIVSSYKQALMAQWLGESLRDAAPEELYTAGLLLDMGFLGLLGAVSAETVTAFREKAARRPLREWPSVERELFGLESRRLTVRLADEWTLGELVKRAAQDREDPDLRIQCVRMGAALIAASARGRDSEEEAEALQEASDRLKISESALVRMLETAEKRAHDFSQELGLTPETPPEARERLMRKEDQSARHGAPAEPPLPDLFLVEDVPLKTADTVRQWELVDDILAYLVDERRGHIQGLLERAVRGLMEGAGLDRVIYLRLTPDGKCLEVKSLHGTIDPRWHGLLIPARGYPNAFAQVLEESPWLWIHEKSQPSTKALITPEVLPFFPSRELFVGRLGLPSKPVGVLAGGRLSGHPPLDEEAFRIFRRLCTLTSLGVALLRP